MRRISGEDEAPGSAVVDGPGRPPVDVVVVTYRSAEDIRECVDAVLAALEQVPKAGVIVVDNHSEDDLEGALAGTPDRVQVLLRAANDGFAAGCHAGAAVSVARRLLFVNPDAQIAPDAVRALLQEADAHPSAGIVGGRSVCADGSTDPQSWMGRPTLWSAFCFGTGLSSMLPGSPVFDPESPRDWKGGSLEVPVVSGGMMLVERRLWDQLGGFDRDFFLYGEDAEFCLRARAAGWRPRVCGAAEYRHAVGGSSRGSNRLPLVLRGRVTTYRKQLPGVRGRVAASLLVMGTGLRAIGAPLRPRGGRPAHPPSRWRDAWRRRREWRRGW